MDFLTVNKRPLAFFRKYHGVGVPHGEIRPILSGAKPSGGPNYSPRVSQPIWMPEIVHPPIPSPMSPVDQLFLALRNGDAATVGKLVASQPALLSSHDARGSTPLLLATYLQQTAVVEALVAQGADVNARDAAGNTPLMGLTFKGYRPLAQYLLDNGADPNASSHTGATALIYAATFGQAEMVDLLLASGADPSVRDRQGQSAADHARANGHHDIARRLG